MSKDKWFLNGGRESGRSYRILFEYYENKVATLEKENAELKETLKTYNGCGDWDNDFHTCSVYLQHEELQKCEELLSKAKEIIKIMKHLLFDVWGYIDFPFEERVNKFLSEVGK